MKSVIISSVDRFAGGASDAAYLIFESLNKYSNFQTFMLCRDKLTEHHQIDQIIYIAHINKVRQKTSTSSEKFSNTATIQQKVQLLAPKQTTQLILYANPSQAELLQLGQYYRVTGQKLTHFPQEDEFEILQPRILGIDQEKTPMNIRADRAIVKQKVQEKDGGLVEDQIHLLAPRNLDFFRSPSYCCATRWLWICATVSMVTLTTISTDVPPNANCCAL